MLAAVIGLNLGLRAHFVCLVEFLSSAPVSDNLGPEAQYLNDFVNAVTNVSELREDYLQGFGLICSS